MTRAVLSIGANLGDRLGQLRSVTDALAPQVVAVSPVYVTQPWGPVPQPDFLNAVVVVDDPTAAPRDWLVAGQRLEQAAGRLREVRWGARTLDVDVVCCRQRRAGSVVLVRSTDPSLTLPHPRAHERLFVLIPWLTVEPDAVLPVGGRQRPIRELVAGFSPQQRAGVQVTNLELRPVP